MKRNIKKMSKLPPELEVFLVTELEAQLAKYFAKPDPKLLESLAKLLERPLEELMANAKADTEDYNKHMVSRLVDKAVNLFMEAGQKGIHNGDIIRVAKDQDFLLDPSQVNGVEITREDFFLDSEEYSSFSYDITIWNEIRGKFILQTEKNDNFAEMLAILDVEMPKYVTEESWQKVKKAIKKSEKRIFNEPLHFPDPLAGFDEGAAQEVSESDYKKLGISKHDLFMTNEQGEVVKREFSEVKIDYRNDNHDLIAMKELVLILQKKKEMGYFSIAPGFFSKYLPELKEEGIDGLIFKVKNEELIDIRIWTSIGTINKKEQRVSPYSPVSAGCALLQEYGSTYVKTDYNSYSLYDLKQINNPIVEADTKYYVLVDGCVSSPEWGTEYAPLSYETYSLNKVQVKAGEVFLFENRNENLMTTRLYFTPYKPTQLHPLHQLGSVVFGSNDQTYHSTVDRNVEDVNKIDIATILNRIQDTHNKENDEQYTASVSAFKFFFCKDKKMGTNILKILKKENNKYISGLLFSLYEITPFSTDYEVEQLYNIGDLYSYEEFKKGLHSLLSNYAPFTKRFLYKEYIKYNQATEKVQITFFNELAQKMKIVDKLSTLKDQNLMTEIEVLGKDPTLSSEAFQEKVNELVKKANKK